jgi:hypothetical protein
VEANRELRLEDVRSISEGLWHMAQLAQDAAETLDARIEDGPLDGARAGSPAQDTWGWINMYLRA